MPSIVDGSAEGESAVPILVKVDVMSRHGSWMWNPLDVPDHVEQLAPRLSVSFLVPEEQAELAWYLAALEHHDPLSLNRALALTENATRFAPQCREAWGALGMVQLRLGDTEKAQKAIANAEGPQSSPELWLLKGLLNYQLGELGEARQDLAEADHVASQSDCMRKVAEHLESELRALGSFEKQLSSVSSPRRAAP